MKITLLKSTTAVLVFAASAGALKGETSADVGILPSQKVPAAIHAKDRNPFATRLNFSEATPDNFEAESEESKIRQILTSLEVNGRVPSKRGLSRVLLGDLILVEGEEVPQLIENQTDVLRVTQITEKEVKITWMGEEEVDAPREVLIQINLKPEVSYLLPGRSSKGGGQFVVADDSKESGAAEEGGEAEEGDKSREDGAGDGLDDHPEREEKAAPKPNQKPKKVSPFGLFKR